MTKWACRELVGGGGGRSGGATVACTICMQSSSKKMEIEVTWLEVGRKGGGGGDDELVMRLSSSPTRRGNEIAFAALLCLLRVIALNNTCLNCDGCWRRLSICSGAEEGAPSILWHKTFNF